MMEQDELKQEIISAFNKMVDDYSHGRYEYGPIKDMEDDLNEMLNRYDIWIEISVE